MKFNQKRKSSQLTAHQDAAADAEVVVDVDWLPARLTQADK